jgi:hypothetical protein
MRIDAAAAEARRGAGYVLAIPLEQVTAPAVDVRLSIVPAGKRRGAPGGAAR